MIFLFLLLKKTHRFLNAEKASIQIMDSKEIWENMDNKSSYLWLYEQSTSRWVSYVLEEPAEDGANLILYEQSTSRWLDYDSTKHAGKVFWDPSGSKYFVS